MATTDWQPIIGLEVHAQLATKSKIFSGSSTQYGALPNSQANLIDLAMPGTLPVLNKETIHMALKFALATNAEIGYTSIFARKNYFYPDLPKGYQISQFEKPIVGKGEISIDLNDGTKKTIGITRAHLEEDAGKSLHEDFVNQTGIDLNRSGTPLLEIVSEPDMQSIEQAISYAKKIHTLVQYLKICDGNMQEGSFRVDANISLHKPGTPFGTRAEIKNINSFRFLEKALEYEIQRQTQLLENGKTVIQETRLYDANNNETRSMRSKEEANDYRYFPCPDLLPVVISAEQIETAKNQLPELPDKRKQRYIDTLKLSEYDAQVLTASKELADYFEAVLTNIPDQAKLVANWVMGELSGRLNKENLYLHEAPIIPKQISDLLTRITDNTISGKIAKEVFDELWQTGATAQVDNIIEQKGLKQITDTSEIETIIDQIITNNPKQVADYQNGKDKLFGFFVGQTMKATQGKANPALVNQLLKQKLAFN